MDERMTRAEQNLFLLHSLFPENEKLYIWCYEPDGHLVASSCPENERELLEPPFTLFEGLEKARAHAGSEGHDRPLILGSPIGMQWAITFETERKNSLIFVIGPVFYAAPVERQLRTALRPYTHERETARWMALLCRRIGELPVMSYAIFSRYVLMVHNTLTGQQLGLDVLDHSFSAQARTTSLPETPRDRTKVYLAERAMLQMVRNGDINYQSVMQGSIRLSPGTPVQGADPLRQMKISITVFTTLVTRAAMEGGLSPEAAYALGDSYIQSAEDCRDSGELTALAHAMYHDFVYRVHHLHANPYYSHAVQKCCDYIELGSERKIRISDLAALCGYTEYYLTEKFKKETGVSVSQYIRFAKVERARVLLESTEMSVREIADKLAFNTVNYFIQSFRDTTGYTPAQYRREKRKG